MFNLSENTKIEIADSSYGDSKKYIKLVRSAAGKKPMRWLNLSTPVWEAFSNITETVTEAAATYPEGDSETRYEVLHNTSVRLSRFMGQLYIGFCQVNKEYTNIINLKLSEWDSLKTQLDDIRSALMSLNSTTTPKKRRGKPTQKKEKKQKLAPQRDAAKYDGDNDECGRANILHQYRCEVRSAEGVIETGDWSFLYEKSVDDGYIISEKYSDASEGVKVEIGQREQILPPPYELLKIVYSFLIRKEVDVIARELCPGCEADCFGQRDHMGHGGCLCEKMDRMNAYTDIASNRVSMQKAVDVIVLLYAKYDFVLNAMFITPKDIPVITNADVYSYSLLDNADYDELFNSLYETM